MSQWVSQTNANGIVHYLATGLFLNISHGFFGLQLATLKLGERIYDAITINYSGKKEINLICMI